MKAQMENFEALLEEYTDQVRATTAAQIDAGCCRTPQDFRKLEKAQEVEGELHQKVIVAVMRLMMADRQPRNLKTPRAAP